jgi:hypothetical protein
MLMFTALMEGVWCNFDIFSLKRTRGLLNREKMSLEFQHSKSCEVNGLYRVL